MLRDFPVFPAPGAPSGPGRSGSPGVGTGPPAVPRPSASVLLVRDVVDGRGRSGVSVYTFRRGSTMAFAPGVVVFPGGAVEPDDEALASQELTDRHVAAVRETFEECGVLLAVSDPAAAATVRPTEPARLRADLLAGRITLVDVLRRSGLVLDAGLLHPWARWVTPTFEPRRYDTTFFVARLPPGQEPGEVVGEGEQGEWVPAAAAVAAHRAGRLPLLPPTLVCLEDMAAAQNVAELMSTERVVRPVSPWAVELPDRADPSPGTPGARWAVRVDLDGRGGGESRDVVEGRR